MHCAQKKNDQLNKKAEKYKIMDLLRNKIYYTNKQKKTK